MIIDHEAQLLGSSGAVLLLRETNSKASVPQLGHHARRRRYQKASIKGNWPQTLPCSVFLQLLTGRSAGSQHSSTRVEIKHPGGLRKPSTCSVRLLHIRCFGYPQVCNVLPPAVSGGVEICDGKEQASGYLFESDAAWSKMVLAITTTFARSTGFPSRLPPFRKSSFMTRPIVGF